MKFTSHITELPDAEIEITVDIALEDLEKERAQVIANFAKNLSLPGFRKGKVPLERAVSEIGEMRILEAVAQEAIANAYPEILERHAIKALGRPHVSITKMAPGNPLSFRIKTNVFPTFTLPDYKKIARTIFAEPLNTEVPPEEVDEAILQLRKMRKHSTLIEQHVEGEPLPKLTDVGEDDLPEVDEAYVKTLGSFTSVEEFKNKLTENLRQEKESREYEKQRMKVVEALIEATKIELPAVIIQYELSRMHSEFEHELTRAGVSFDDYLKNVGKTRADLEETWHPEAKKRSLMQIILNEIAEKEGLEPDKERLEKELSAVKERYKNLKDFSEESAHAYLHQMLTNQAVFEFLEQKKS